jgi:hypothetical protein
VLPVPDVAVDSADFARGGWNLEAWKGWSGTAGGSRARPGEPATASGSAKAEPRHAADGEKVAHAASNAVTGRGLRRCLSGLRGPKVVVSPRASLWYRSNNTPPKSFWEYRLYQERAVKQA